MWQAGNSFQNRSGSKGSNSHLFLSCCFCSRKSWTFLASRRVRSASSFSNIWATRSYCTWLVPVGGKWGHGECPVGGTEPTQHGLCSQAIWFILSHTGLRPGSRVELPYLTLLRPLHYPLWLAFGWPLALGFYHKLHPCSALLPPEASALPPGYSGLRHPPDPKEMS